MFIFVLYNTVVKQLNFFCLFFLCSVLLQAQPTSVDAGPYRKVCPDTSITLGGSPTASGGVAPLTYSWQPASSLSSATVANPIAYPNATTTYTVIVTDATTKSKTDTVTIFLYSAYLNAGLGASIQQGQTITLHAQAPGASQIYWSSPNSNIYNQNTFNPDVFPPVTSTYTVVATFPHGCIVYDRVTVHVTPSNNLYFFNTFTPNGDGANDVFYVGNLEKYPDNVLEIYNRYGQKVFNKTGYQNDWDGKYLNEELPAGTYFYILDTKSPTGGKYKGSVTIIR